MPILPSSRVFDQRTMTLLMEHDALVQRFRSLFALFEWSVVPEPSLDPSRPGKRPHPQRAYIKAFCSRLVEGLTTCTRLRRFLVEHPLLVLELGFRPVSMSVCPMVSMSQRTVPSDRWLREKQRTLAQPVLHALLEQTRCRRSDTKSLDLARSSPSM